MNPPKKFFLSILSDLAILLFLTLIQLSFVMTLPRPLENLNIILSFIIFITVILNYHRGLFWAVGAGILLDIYTLEPFGVTSISLYLTVIIMNYLFDHFFTNRSYYTLFVLGILGTALFNILLILVKMMLSWFNIKSLLSQPKFIFTSFLSDVVWQAGLNVLCLFIIFFVFNYMSRKAQSVFLVSE